MTAERALEHIRRSANNACALPTFCAKKKYTEEAAKANAFLLCVCSSGGLIKVDQATLAPGFWFHEARIGTVEGGESGVLVWKFDQLVAILTQIDEEAYSTKGKWFLETGFGLLTGQHKTFDTIEEAVGWVGERTFPDPIHSFD